MTDTVEPRRFRTIWISDVHLGTHDCKADALLAFLKDHESETLYLVGDVVDGWALRRGWHWPQAHNDVVQKVLRKARKGTRVVFVPGNHDEFARAYAGHSFGGVEVALEAMHVTADGRRLWVVHGDAFDPVVTRHRWLVPLSSGFLAFLRWLHVPWAWRTVRPLLGRPYRSLAALVKNRANAAMAALGDFEKRATEGAKRRGADGVVCGHVHVPASRVVNGVLYLNDGDWVESCTALVEHRDGRLEILRVPPIERRPPRRPQDVRTAMPPLLVAAGRVH
ncbi:MAG TPA: UDP-2,3-diacylglucosamine diphosphatase [Planctomycetota bacterium]|nr:UDP-2,3-diacylglucosamine diphosphatase [Planctomycetota bacterium]